MNRFAFGIHRGGSTILGKICREVATQAQVPLEILGNSQKQPTLFGEIGDDGASSYVVDQTGKRIIYSGMPELKANISNWEIRSNSFFAPIRNAKYFPVEFFNEADCGILNIRDPRDCMTSGYYGFLLLHGNKLEDQAKQQMYEAGIDSYVTDQLLERFETKLNDYIDLINSINSSRFAILKYETMVCDFSKWFKIFCQKLDFNYSELENIEKSLAENFKPVQKEDVYKHKRQMLPGDYKAKLKLETINLINERLKDQLEFFGYM